MRTHWPGLNCFIFVLCIAWFWGLGVSAYSQNKPYKYIRNYSPKEYNQQPQNWAILQDGRGIVCIGNHGGLFEYDGVTWREHYLTVRTVRSMTVDQEGTLFIGGKNKLGFIEVDRKGKFQYVSLVPKLDPAHRNFGNVWKTHSTGDAVYFRTSGYLYRWTPHNQEMRVWHPENPFKGSFQCNNRIFIYQPNIGLLEVQQDTLRLIKGGDFFADKRVYAVVPYDNKQLLIGTGEHGFYLYNDNTGTLIPFVTNADTYLKKSGLYCGIPLNRSPGHFAMGTSNGGIVIFDSRGTLIDIFNKNRGLQDNNVRFLYEDSQGNIWSALNNGISKIEYSSPISFFDNRNGLEGLVLSVCLQGDSDTGMLVVGTTAGLFAMPRNSMSSRPGSATHFQRHHQISTDCWALLSTGESLLTATSEGVYLLNNDRKHKISKQTTFCLIPSRKENNRIWAGTENGLVSLITAKADDGKITGWKEERVFDSISHEIRTIAEDNKGNLWMGTTTSVVLKKKVDSDIITVYNESHGLPKEECNVFYTVETILVGNADGIYRLDQNRDCFIPTPILGDLFIDGDHDVFRLVQDKYQNVWFQSEFRFYRATPQTGGKYQADDTPFLRINKVQANSIYCSPNGDAVWFATHNGLFRFDASTKKNYKHDFNALIRKVVVNGEAVFFGHKVSNTSKTGNKNPAPTIPYENRNIRFQYAAPFFENEAATQYSFHLIGYDPNWSGWTNETQKDYTNLDEGTYTFRIRAKNVYEHLSKEDSFSFKVLPPWYRTWWAFIMYFLLLVLVMYLMVKWRSWKLVQEKRKLEQTIRERTKEIAEKNLQLEDQSEKLKEMDRVKSRFFANISHEFRTPLTLIIGPLENISAKKRNVEEKKKLWKVIRNAQKLLALINQLLDLSRLDNHKMGLQAFPNDIVLFIKGVVDSFDYAAVRNELTLSLDAEQPEIMLYFNPEKMEKIIGNILSNAMKFTPPGGKITIFLRSDTTPGNGKFPQGHVEITVSDTGIGIPDDKIAHIFDRFYQVEMPAEYMHKGSGIGLALARELVQLHHGTIDVVSRHREPGGSGTQFVIRFPLGSQHLKPEEIATQPDAQSSAAEVHPNPELYRPADKIKRIESPQAPGSSAEPVQKETGDVKEDKKVILVVDDSDDMREYIRNSLETHYTVIEAADVKEGVQKAQDHIPDLIVSDIMMPGEEGYALCRRVKKHIKTSHIPVIFLSAKSSEESIVLGLETGGDDYITKPFSTKVLLARVNNLIRLRRKMQEKIQRRVMAQQPGELDVSSMDREFLGELQQVIESHIADPDFGVDNLTKVFYMSQSSLYRKIHALTGESPNRFIRSCRLKKAFKLLKSKSGNVTEVAFAVGFSNTAYFAKCFKEKFNRLPSSF